MKNNKTLLLTLIALIIILISFRSYSSFISLNGFDLSKALIPIDEIKQGGPAKDGIPALTSPQFISASKAHYLNNQDRILGLAINGKTKAYPIAILNWHEIVNDTISGQDVIVNYCPLCGTGMAFSSKINNKKHVFGVSGLLYESDVLLYDKQTESLWSQLLGTAISGKYKGKKLKPLVIDHTTWGAWKKQHPKTVVLSDKTGFNRDYKRNPYAGYKESRALYFSVSKKAPARFHPKEQVLGLEINGQFKAYPFVELNKAKTTIFTDQFAGQAVTVKWDKKNQSGKIFDQQGKALVVVQSFWFAWFTFHSKTEIFEINE